MKYYKAQIATSHVDKHNDVISVNALKDLVEQINACYMPVGIEHDPRIPPIGRIESAELKQLDDGEFAVEATICCFEKGDTMPVASKSGKELKIKKMMPLGEMGVGFDRSYFNAEAQEVINEVNALLKSREKPQYDIKKALDPLSILTIFGTFVVGGIAGGVAQKIGSDGWDAFKKKVKVLLDKNQAKEKLLRLDTTIQRNNLSINVEIILSDPSSSAIDNFFEHGIKKVDEILDAYFKQDDGMRKLVLEYKNSEIYVKFGVLQNGWPVPFHNNKPSQ